EWPLPAGLARISATSEEERGAADRRNVGVGGDGAHGQRVVLAVEGAGIATSYQRRYALCRRALKGVVQRREERLCDRGIEPALAGPQADAEHLGAVVADDLAEHARDTEEVLWTFIDEHVGARRDRPYHLDVEHRLRASCSGAAIDLDDLERR